MVFLFVWGRDFFVLEMSPKPQLHIFPLLWSLERRQHAGVDVCWHTKPFNHYGLAD